LRYALLGYDLDHALDELAAEDKRALHRTHASVNDNVLPDGVKLITHYRFRPARQTTTLRPSAHDLIREEGAASAVSSTLRALYIVESDDPEAVVTLAGQLPALAAGATIEIWPLGEPGGSSSPSGFSRGSPYS
jgi:hypothetical protein